MIVQFDNVKAQLSEYTASEAEKIRRTYRTFVPGYRYSKLFRMKRWDGKTSLFDPEKGTLPTGFVPQLQRDFPGARFIDVRPCREVALHATTVSLRPYQSDVVVQAFRTNHGGTWWPRGVIQAATGAGKTRIAAAMIDMTRDLNTLFLVHRQQLLSQTERVFEELGIDTSRVQVMTVQGLMSWAFNLGAPTKKKGETAEEFQARCQTYEKRLATQDQKTAGQLEFLKSIDQVFVDEAHLVASSMDQGNLFTRALELMPNAFLRWGLTATPFMRAELHDWMLEGATGGQLSSITTKFLIDQGYLARPKISVIRLPPIRLSEPKWPYCYEEGIVHNEVRNKSIVQLMREQQGPILTFVSRRDHGDVLEGMARDAGLTAIFIDGQAPHDVREKAAADLASGRVKVVIASKIWDEGMDIPEIQTMILAGGEKSAVKTIQRLGRSLRGGGEVNIFDFMDTSSKILKGHSLARQKVWRAEGHEIRYV